METGRLDEAEDVLGRAVSQVPDWEAAHFEVGKLWLRRDDTKRAAAAFAEASRLMPSFAAAHANLGAALGELERPEEALAALERAACLDPFGHPIHNNVGASLRDLGRLHDAETSFRRVIALAPGFVFGHYNLGHVLLLQGRFAEARDAYEGGLTRDPSRTPRQRLRLALTLAAMDDEAPATTHARAALNDTPAERRAELLDEMAVVLEALAALHGERRPGVRALEQVAGDYRSSIPRN
jgi:tetratricopeptide (TPR) repeat protein